MFGNVFITCTSDGARVYVMMHFNDKINKIKPIQQKQRELLTKLIDLSRLVNMMCKNTIQP